jgi:serine protease Do
MASGSPHRIRWSAALAIAVCSLAANPAIGQSAQTPAAVAGTPQAYALPDFSSLVEQVGPAVVNIRTTQRAKPTGEDAEMNDEARELFRRFFGVPPPNAAPRRGTPQTPDDEQVQRGVGSGFIVSADGVILTNAHVVDGADEVYVRLPDKREFKAKVLGADKRSDVAVVKIEATNLPSVRFGDNSKLKVGEWVIAIGSPFNLDNSVTAGIVSAKARDTGDLVPLIQTDVAINPGNSGGPLINLRGEVVGINSQIYSRSGGYMGISFAIPGDEALRIATQLRATGRVERGRLGVRIGEVTPEVAEALGLPRAAGALVRGAEEGGPAEKAGITGGDIITRFNDQPIEKWTDLPRVVSQAKPGTQGRLQVLRNGAYRDIAIAIAPQEPEAGATKKEAPAAPPAPKGHAGTLGLKVSDIPDADKRKLKLADGVRVDAVEGVVARVGLREGDILIGVANQTVTSAKQLEALLARADRSKPLALLVRRGDLTQYAIVRPSR